MTTKLYIGNLPFQTTEAEIRQLCAPFGSIKSITMIRDRDSNRFRGFCFVEMEKRDADKARSALNGKQVSGRKIRVNKAKPRKQQRAPQKRQAEEIPLHERTQRGGYGADGDAFPHTGRGRRSGEYRSRDNSGEYRSRDNSGDDFPNSGGSARGS